MKKCIKVIAVILLSLSGRFAYSQQLNDKEKESVRHAIELMEGGKHEEAISLLKELDKTAPKTQTIPYEIGFAYQLKGDLEKATTYFRESCTRKDANDLCYA